MGPPAPLRPPPQAAGGRNRLCRAASRLLLALFLLVARPAAAQSPPAVILLPAAVHGPAEYAYLRGEMSEALRRELAEEGVSARVLDPETAAAWAASGGGDEEIARLALQTGADFVAGASLTWIGEAFSLDVRLVPAAAADRGPRTFAAEGRRVEQLPGVVKRVAREIANAALRRERIVEVRIEGQQRIEPDAIRRVLKSRPGEVLQNRQVAEDLKAVYGLGYFDDVQILREPEGDGVRLIVRVTEKPTVRSIRTTGNVVFDQEEIRKNLTLKQGAVLNAFTLRSDLRRIEDLYRGKNYHNVRVNYRLTPHPNNQVDVEYAIEEGNKLLIRKIAFIGNTAFSERRLKKEIQTSEKNILSWFTAAGDLKPEQLNQDAARLAAFYQNNGYVRARVGEPQVEFEEEGIVVTFKIDEGPRFRMGRVDFSGDLLLPREELLKKLKITREEYYNREVLRGDVIALTDLYADEGYAYVEVSPKVDQDAEKLIAHVTFQILKGKPVVFEEITITGNTKTRDKVIRRELRVFEQELYSASRLKRGIRNLNRLDYFENVKVDTARGSADDRMRMSVEVKEKNTGAFTFGAGYSTFEQAFVTASISERNLFGRGQTLGVRGQVGGKTQKYVLSFTEPWLFDIPLSAGAELYKWEFEFDDYDKDSIGGKLRLGYPLYDYVRGSIAYTLEETRISNVDEDAARSIQKDAGRFLKSSIAPVIRYDSRDSLFNAKEGSLHSLEYEFAGLGGDVGFHKVIADTGWYIPLVWKLTGVVHGRGGYIHGLPGWDLPDYEKFYLGGMNTVRGAKRADLAPKEEGDPVGGEKFVQGNFEIKFPLVEEAGVFGILFLDTGAVFGKDESWDFNKMRETAGPEIRWMSPIGPIRLAYGWYLDPKKDDRSSGGFEFSMASAF